MTPEIWTARAKLPSFRVLMFVADKDGARTPRDNEPGLPPEPPLPGPHPWRDEHERKLRLTALELKRMMLQGLRDGLEGHGAKRREDPLEQEPAFPTWESPIVYREIEYPLFDETLRPPVELEDETEALRWISVRLNEQRGRSGNHVLAALELLTLGAFVRRNGKTQPVIPIPFFERYERMTEPERERFLARWFSPVSHGDSYFEDAAGRAMPGADASLQVRATNERAFQAAVVFEVYPLMLDLDAGRAFYALKVGLPWDGNTGSPATWSEQQRQALWSALFKSLDTLAAYYKKETDTLPDQVEISAYTLRAEAGHYDVSTETKETIVPPAEILASASSVIEPVTIAATAEIIPRRDQGGRKVFPIAFGTAYADAGAVAFVQQSHHLRLPRSWAQLSKWEDLKQDRIKEILNSPQATDAFQDFRHSTGNPLAWAKLRKVYLPGRTTPVTDFTPEEERELRRHHGTGRGFLDRDPKGRQALYRCVVDRKGNLLEIWLSWFGMAEPLFRDRLDQKKRETLARLPKEDPTEPELFDDLDDELRRKLNRELERLNLYEHGRSVMEGLLGVFGKYRTNPVEIPAEGFRHLLWPTGTWPQDWKQVVERTLGALMAMTSAWRAGNLLGEAVFVNSWQYVPLGRGGHGEGVYTVGITPPFVGSLKYFETADTPKLRSGVDAVVYDFSKNLPPEDRKALNFVSFDAGRTFYHAAAGLSAVRRNLVNWLEREITLKRDPIPKGRKHQQLKPKAPDANAPRLYDCSFCPLLPEGQHVAALGHFRRNPEVGFTLYGTASRASKASGGHIDGLVAVLGYPLAPGRAHDARRNVVRQVLEDIKAVAVDYLGGMVVGKFGGRTRGREDWLPLDKWTDLDEETLCRKLKVFFFLPMDWNQRRRDRFEKVTGYRVTESIAEAQAATWGSAGPVVNEATAKPQAVVGQYRGEADGWQQLGPLPNRLYAALMTRKLKRTDLARIFGVTPGAVTRWLHGMKLGEDTSKAKRIPEDLAALMVRWLETGQAPTAGELAALPSRSRTPRFGTRRPASDAA